MSPFLTSFRELGREHDADECKNIENLRDVIFKIRESPELGSQIIRAFVERNSKALPSEERLPDGDSKFLINFSNLFYGNLYLEDKTALSKHSNFVHTFLHFM